MKNNSHLVLVSIINWNNNDATNNCLASIAKIAKAHQPDVYLIDNNSQREELLVSSDIAQELKSLTVTHNKANKGFAGGHNDAIAFAAKNNYDYVCLLNNDAEIIDLDIFTKLTTALNNNKSAIAAAPTILSSTKPPVIWFGGGTLNTKKADTNHNRLHEVVKNSDSKDIQNVSFLTGCCLMISLCDALLDVTLSEDYFLYYEDADWCARMQQKGKTLLYVPDAQLLHAPSSSLGIRSASYAYYNIRNRLLFAKKWHATYIAVTYGTLITSTKIILLSMKQPHTFISTVRMVVKALNHGVKNKGGAL